LRGGLSSILLSFEIIIWPDKRDGSDLIKGVLMYLQAVQTKADLIAGGLLYIFYSQHSCKYISTPFIRSLPSLLSGQIMISNDSKILLNRHRLVGSLFHCRMGGLTKGVLLF
jgi:hypothetical protein